MILVFAKFCQYTQSWFRMEESDIKSFRTFARSFVDKADFFAFCFCKCISYTVLYGECHVMNARAFVLNKFGDGTFGAGGF